MGNVPLNLHVISEQLRKISDSLGNMSNNSSDEKTTSTIFSDECSFIPTGQTAISNLAREYVRFRKARERYFTEDLFHDPAWNIMIDLLIAQEEGRRTSVSSACVDAGTSPTTALRWVQALERRGLVSRVACSHDKRKFYLSLTPQARAALVELLSKFSFRPLS